MDRHKHVKIMWMEKYIQSWDKQPFLKELLSLTYKNLVHTNWQDNPKR